MNILPVVFAFLLILSCISLTFLKEIKSSFIIETAFRGFNASAQNVNNELAQKGYQKAGKKSKKRDERGHEKKERGPDQPKNKKDYVYKPQRSHFPPGETSKFNLNVFTQLFSEPKQHPMYEVLGRLLRSLYQDRLFSKEDNSQKMEYRLIEAWLKQIQNHPEIKNICDLYPEDPDLHHVFYKMLKGTNQYDRLNGIPPLEHFLCFRKAKTAVSMNFASELLLETLFDLEAAKTILQEEQKRSIESKKKYYLSKENLQNCLKKYPVHTSNLTQWEPYIDFSKKIDLHKLGKKDKNTGIYVEKALKS